MRFLLAVFVGVLALLAVILVLEQWHDGAQQAEHGHSPAEESRANHSNSRAGSGTEPSTRARPRIP